MGAFLGVNPALESDMEQRKEASDYAVTILKSPEEVYAFWKQWSWLQTVSRHLKSVREVEPGITEWVSEGPTGELKWKARTIADIPGEKIAWETLPDSPVNMAGAVLFHPAPGDRGTEVTVKVRFSAPGGAIGEWIARLSGDHPEQQVAAAMRAAKAILECGEMPRVEGQPSDIKRGDPNALGDSRKVGLR